MILVGNAQVVLPFLNINENEEANCMINTIKKIVAAVVIAALLVGNLGLFSTPVSAQGPVELVFWHGMGGSVGEALQRIVDQFNESQDEITVNAQYQGSYDETLTQLRSQATGSEVGADLVQVFEVGTTFMIDSGLTVPVQEFVDSDGYDLSQIEPNLAAYYTVNETLH